MAETTSDHIADAVVASHWLLFDRRREVVGCHCGVESEPDDCGYGDAIIRHIAEVAADIAMEARA